MLMWKSVMLICDRNPRFSNEDPEGSSKQYEEQESSSLKYDVYVKRSLLQQ